MIRTSEKFLSDANKKAFDDKHRRIINFNIGKYNHSVAVGKSHFADLETARTRANFLKWKAIENLESMLVQFEANFTKRGGKVLWANDAEEAMKEVLKICRKVDARSVVKSKSMVTEEIHLNDVLEKNAIKVYETDLGEFIVQLNEEPPYHIVTPAMHLSKEDIADIFHKKLNTAPGLSPEALTLHARELLRKEYLNAEVGISGANFIVADTGSIAITENEGNARMSTTFPKVHIAIVGIEKIIPSMLDLDLFFPLLGTHGTGQLVTVYNTILSGPRQEGELDGPEEMYVILLDNGRTNILANVDQRQSLYCIRCGACLNACPVYKTVGGHSYGTTYSGPVGSVITPNMKGMEEFRHLSYASSLCGNCTEVCPVRIDLHKLLLYNRRDAVQQNLTSKMEGYGWFVWRQAMMRRKWFNLPGPKMKKMVVRYGFTESSGVGTMPELPEKSFNQLWREKNRELPESMNFKQYQESPEVLLSLYKSLVKPRMIEEKMLVLLRQGKVSKWFSGIGQEAISVGLTSALAEQEYIFPLHRNLGVFTTRKMPLGRLFAQLQGKYEGYSKGRERSFHFGAKEHHIVGMISHLGPQLTLANGAALSSLLDGQPQVAAAFTGDGGTSEGDFHEALNVAAVWQLPVIFVIENNGYGLSTPTSEQYRCKSFIDKGLGYGMEAVQIDGNNILEVYQTVKKLADDMRVNPRPILLECMTFRMRGHEEASGTKYVPQELFDIWSKKDPVVNFEQYLLEEKLLDQNLIELVRSQVKSEIDEGLNFAFALPEPDNSLEEELGDVYAPWQQTLTAPSASTSDKRLCDAISDGLKLAMEKHQDLVLMGQDIAEYGGVFKITEGFVEQFGKHRVRNTPLCESAILGCGLGLSISGKKAMVEMQFADFVTSGFNQIVNNLAKMHYRWGQHADVVVRMPTGAGVGAGPFHSQSNEAWFVHTPGLKVVYPSNPIDAKGLLLAAFEDPNPYLFFEHKALYRSLSAAVPDGYYTLPIGKAAVASEGNEVTIITYGLGVHWALEAAKEHGEGVVEVIDLRTLLPWDKETVFESVKKTGRVMVMHEDCQTGGIGGEIAATIAEECFRYLDAPVSRHGSLDTPVPFSPALENKFLGKNRFKRKLKDL